ncbi:MAG TPA: hypothetical protein VGL20_14685 [Candidatus Dormibacteraeota bacterium]
MSQQATSRRTGAVVARLRPVAAAAALLGAVLLVPLVRMVPGDGATPLALDAYLPQHPGERLTYRLNGSLRATVELRLASRRITAGVPTLSLERLDPPAGATVLPFGLSGGTVRVEGDTVVRTAEGGTVRDLVGPVAPGRTWTDSRRVAATGGAGTTFTVTEDRTLLGPAALDEPAGHLDHCLVVEVVSRATSAGGSAATAGATLWYCEGVGLARAVLRGGGSGDTVDLVAVTGR